MPRNRRPQDREEKRAEIVDAATALFVEAGFDGTPLSRIAQSAGVTPNTIYWYFSDKDELLVAALTEITATALTRFAELEVTSPQERLTWVVTELERYHRLVDTVHARAAVSAPIDEWHNGFHALADALVAEELRHVGVAEERIDARTKVVVFAVEGMLTHPQSAADKAAIVDALFT
ncbi:TetR/AcrR family transcriptional regulator [Rhodococcus sp. BP-241]|uniref:TetR/AcrR family transcriptional regulator n=1 Tax=Rhodococcus sp. BP-241 TaxID=2739441 RepID=UPI001C9AE5E1|nr:TetR/AcrR family transcriptional regulator [Rhodococcus sp. BP-241]MBY6706152.1 TetR/AcrR family transcriptional regulator [Rhodococcus sp. BP-241]